MSATHLHTPRARAVVIHDDTVLLLRRVKKGTEYYCFPGGEIESGETPQEAAVRETLEETGISIAIQTLFCEITVLGRPEYYFRAIYRGGEVALGGEEKERHQEDNQYYPQWYPLTDALQLPNLLPREVVSLLTRVDDPEHRLGTSKPIEKTKRDTVRAIVWVALAAVALIAISYVTVVSPIFRLQKTSPNAAERQVAPIVDERVIALPLQVIRLTGEEYGTQRSPESVASLIENASHIWQQARIEFIASQESEYPITPDDFADLQYKPHAFIGTIPRNEDMLTVILIKELRGLNGISYAGTNVVFVADYTSRPDFRVLAHELGHQLGLEHSEGEDSALMNEDSVGIELSSEEVRIAREMASQRGVVSPE